VCPLQQEKNSVEIRCVMVGKRANWKGEHYLDGTIVILIYPWHGREKKRDIVSNKFICQKKKVSNKFSANLLQKYYCI